MNRYKKEEKKRGKKFPTRKMTREEFLEMLDESELSYRERVGPGLRAKFRWLEEKVREILRS